jgi:putative addiction module CopG family antidote
MELSLKPKDRKFIEQKIRSGKYASANDVVQAAFAALQQQEKFGDFSPGELDRLLEEGERSIRREGVFDADEVFAELRRESRRLRRSRKPE